MDLQHDFKASPVRTHTVAASSYKTCEGAEAQQRGTGVEFVDLCVTLTAAQGNGGKAICFMNGGVYTDHGPGCMHAY